MRKIILILIFLFNDSLMVRSIEDFYDNEGDSKSLEIYYEGCNAYGFVEHYCMHCGALIECDAKVDNKGTYIVCPSGQTCDYGNTNTCIDTASNEAKLSECVPNLAGNFPMPELSKNSITDDSWFISCFEVPGSSKSTECRYTHCSNDKIFDKTHCVNCQSQFTGILPGCKEAFACFKEQDIFIQKQTLTCGKDMIYSSSLGACTKKDGTLKCIDQKFKDPFDCHRYQECKGESDYSEGICCDVGKVFDDNISTCVDDTGYISCELDECYSYNFDELDPCHQCPGLCENMLIKDRDESNDYGFIRCVKNSEGKYDEETFTCPEGHVFKGCFCKPS